MYFPRTGCESRTNEGFRKKIYGDHHKSDSPLLQLDIDMVEDFPVGDSLHLIDLGIMKRCLLGWRDGSFGTYISKWCYKDIKTVSDFLIKCKMPIEIHRAIRDIGVLAHWKATEYRTFLLYLSITILKRVLTAEVYQHFLLFFCAITICTTDVHIQKLLPLAESMLEHYIEHYRDFYGEHYMTSNVHNLSHLIHEVRRFGILSMFNAYPFENRLYQIKQLLRTGNCPLSQIAKRISEIFHIEANTTPDIKNITFPYLEKAPDIYGRSKEVKFQTFLLNTKFQNKWFLTTEKKIISMHYAKVENNKIVIYGQPLKYIKDVFETPIRSSILNIYKSDITDAEPLEAFDFTRLLCKMVAVEDNDNNFVFVPLLHSYSNY